MQVETRKAANLRSLKSQTGDLLKIYSRLTKLILKSTGPDYFLELCMFFPRLKLRGTIHLEGG